MSECNVENRTIFCDDNLDVMRGINSDCIDLIYLDPPFNKNKKFTAPIGSSAEGASFKDIFREEDLKDEWVQTIREDQPDLYHYLNGIKGVGKPYNFAYLAYMAIRLIECRRILKPTGSLYLHCDPTMSHYLKTTMDCIFSEDNFRNEVVWSYRRWTAGNKNFQRMHDVVLRYTGSDKFIFNVQYEPYGDWIKKDYGYVYEETGKRWRWHTVKGKRYKVFLEDENKGVKLNDVWTIPYLGSTAKERTGYPTQKPIALLERIIQASSNEGDTVLDPFCGCATTCVAAERLGRTWIGIDISIKAYELVQERLVKEAADPEDIFKYQNVIHLKTDPPTRTDQEQDYREQKYVYIISHPNFPGEYKVGIAKDWKARLNAYQTSDPERQYKTEYKLLTPWFRETEQYIHDKFDNKHEWVAAGLDDIIQAIEGYKPIADAQQESLNL